MYMTSANNQVWTIFDANFDAQMSAASALSNYNNSTSGPLTQLFMSGEADAANPPSHAQALDFCLANGSTLTSDTFEGLAEQIGIDPQALTATVERYNELVDKGVDEDFGKNAEDMNAIVQPPFYASALTAKLLVIASGLNVNSEMQVIDKDGNPIVGLYAVGNVMGNYFANDYPSAPPARATAAASPSVRSSATRSRRAPSWARTSRINPKAGEPHKLSAADVTASAALSVSCVG